MRAGEKTKEGGKGRRGSFFELTPGWSTMITASKSQTSVSDNNLVKTSFKNGVEPVEEEAAPGRSRSRAPQLRYYILAIRNKTAAAQMFYEFTCEMTMQQQATSLRMIRPLGARPQGQGRGLSSAYLRCTPSLGHWQAARALRSVVRAVRPCERPDTAARALSPWVHAVSASACFKLYVIFVSFGKGLPASERWNRLIDLVYPNFNTGGDNAYVLTCLRPFRNVSP